MFRFTQNIRSSTRPIHVKRRRKQSQPFQFEPLERRQLLATSATPLTDSLVHLSQGSGPPPGWIVSDAAGRLGVTVKAANIDAVIPELVDAGFEVTDVSNEHYRVEGLVERGDLEGLADVPNLWGILPTYNPIRFAGSIPSDADYIHEADRVRDELPGVDGSGIRIGVLSDSYNNLAGEAADIASGDLPNSITVIEDLPSGGSDEGRAMLQLIHDVAPGADLGFATAFTGQIEFANHIRELADPNIFDADVIVDDVIYFDEPFFQDGIVAQAVDDVVQNDGAAYFSSAGNNDTQSYEAVDPSFVTDASFFNARIHDFDPGPGEDTRQLFQLDNSSINLAFQWDDPFFTTNGVDTDVDIFLVEAGTDNIVASATDDNVANRTPFESLRFTGTGDFELIIQVFSGPDPGRIKWVDFGTGDTVQEFDTDSSTVFGHAAASSARAVAAAPFFNHQSPESFTSAGNTTILFDAAGNPISPDVRLTPDITAVDGIENTFFGQQADFDGDGVNSFHFFGTSAAAPNAAAVAALVLDANPTFSVQQIYDALESTATDLGTPGRDNLTGVGLINAFDAIFGNGATPATLVQSGSTATYTETFDDGQLSTEWETLSSGGGRIRVIDGNASSGTGRLSMDAASNGFSPQSLNEAILHLDLDGFENVVLQFDNAETGDEDTALPTVFTGSVNGDGVSFSVDGVTWFTLLSFTGGDSSGTFQTQQFDLSAAALAAGVTLGSDTQIKFQQFDNFSEPSDGISIDSLTVTADVIDLVAPSVEMIVINNGDEQRSMVNQITVNFSEVVNVSAADFILENTDNGTTITPDVSTQVIDGKTSATLTFSGTGVIGGSLADGNYSLTVLDSITDTAGNVLDGDGDGSAGGNATDEFFRFYGDVNGDRTVNILDFFQFRNAFGDPDTLDERFDFNGDGVVNILDFFQFRSRFGTSI